MIIRDALSLLAAKVNSSGDLQVVLGAASEFTPIDPLQVAAKLGNACIVSAGYTAGTDDEVFYIRNTDSIDCIVERLIFSADAVTNFQGFTVTGTAAGGALTVVSLNPAIAFARALDIRGGAAVTGLTPVDEFLNLHAIAGTIYDIPVGIRLSLNDDIAISSTLAVNVSVGAIIRWDP